MPEAKGFWRKQKHQKNSPKTQTSKSNNEDEKQTK
jgi:hypothetical protein